MAKGEEYDRVIVIAPELAVDQEMREDMALNALYVALSRSRGAVTVFASREIAEVLRQPGVEVTI